MARLLLDRRPLARRSLGVLTLASCCAVYAAFHATRDGLGEGLVRSSLPSFLLPITMTATLDLAPRIRFRNRATRALAVLAATLIAAAWFEGFVPRFVASSVADWRDAAAMLLGGAVAAVAPLTRPR